MTIDETKLQQLAEFISEQTGEPCEASDILHVREAKPTIPDIVLKLTPQNYFERLCDSFTGNITIAKGTSTVCIGCENNEKANELFELLSVFDDAAEAFGYFEANGKIRGKQIITDLKSLPTPETFAYSYDDEHFHGSFDTRDQAIAEAFENAEAHDAMHFLVGRCVPPTQPEDRWEAYDWLEQVSCQDEYRGDHAEDWDDSTKDQREELEKEVRSVMAAWLDRHGLRPRFYLVTDIENHVIENGTVKSLPKPLPNVSRDNL